MAILSGGGNWLSLQGTKDSPAPVGSVTIGQYVDFKPEVPSSNPAYPPQDVLSLIVNGETKLIGCPTALGRVFRANQIVPGTVLRIEYEGRKVGKRGTQFHSFKVETVDGAATAAAAGDASFSFGANASSDAGTDLERRLAEARARRGQ